MSSLLARRADRRTTATCWRDGRIGFGVGILDFEAVWVRVGFRAVYHRSHTHVIPARNSYRMAGESSRCREMLNACWGF
jgi:hypothetical protein